MADQRFFLASCLNCGQHIEFPAEGAGMSVICPHCAKETVLKDERPAAPNDGEEITAAELQAAMEGVVSRPQISIFYQVGLLAVAVFMVLLPLAYLAFAALAAYCVYWYAIHGQALFTSFVGGFQILVLKVVFYVGPLVGGTVAVFFMLKPILARPRKSAQAVELNPSQNPRLYQFIAHLTDLLRVPMPKRIFLDCELNASAGLRRGWLSIFGSDLVLNLGLPLVAGLNTRQFAAVVSHELGHCTQSFAMRVEYVINKIDGWFYRVVYERDSWDESFENWANSVADWRINLIVACAGFAIWLSRKALALLMQIGHAASCFLSRQMEFHADACATAVAGSAGLESLLIRLRERAVIQRFAYDGLDQIWRKQHQLPDSLPEYLDQLEQRLPAGFHEQARLTLLNETSGWFASHPTSAKRIQQARQQAVNGIFALEKPARLLFKDFPCTARRVTSQHYRQNLRLPITDPMLKPVTVFFAEP